MKIIFEFDTDSENFDRCNLKRFQNIDKICSTLNEILNKVRGWDKYDDREQLSKEEVCETIWGIIKDNCIDGEELQIW